MALTAAQLHPTAMDIAEEAFELTRSGDHERANRLFEIALSITRLSAELLPPEPDSEPSRGILYRSAAALAMNCKQYLLGIELAQEGLSNNPPAEIRQELTDIIGSCLDEVSAIKRPYSTDQIERFIERVAAMEDIEQVGDEMWQATIALIDRIISAASIYHYADYRISAHDILTWLTDTDDLSEISQGQRRAVCDWLQVEPEPFNGAGFVIKARYAPVEITDVVRAFAHMMISYGECA